MNVIIYGVIQKQVFGANYKIVSPKKANNERTIEKIFIISADVRNCPRGEKRHINECL